jgi:hypothetical protein
MSGADGALGVTQPAGCVQADGKEVQQVQLLQRRLGAARLNVGPPLAVYMLLLALLAEQWVAGQ